MNPNINLVAVLLATVASMIVGSLWYTPNTLGKYWMKLAGLTLKDLEKNGMNPLIGAIVASLVTAVVLAHFIAITYQYYQPEYSYLTTSLITAFLSWLGFTGVRIWTHDSFEGRPLKLTLLNAAHELATFLGMGLAIGIIGQ